MWAVILHLATVFIIIYLGKFVKHVPNIWKRRALLVSIEFSGALNSL